MFSRNLRFNGNSCHLTLSRQAILYILKLLTSTNSLPRNWGSRQARVVTFVLLTVSASTALPQVGHQVLGLSVQDSGCRPTGVPAEGGSCPLPPPRLPLEVENGQCSSMSVSDEGFCPCSLTLVKIFLFFTSPFHLQGSFSWSAWLYGTKTWVPISARRTHSNTNHNDSHD